MSDHLSREERRRLMARVRTRDTAPELMLRKALWAAGLRGWRLHPRLPGRPDLAWRRQRVAMFVDGAFWHGHPDYYRGQSGPFWDEKIARNRARDEEVNRHHAFAGCVPVLYLVGEPSKIFGGCPKAFRRFGPFVHVGILAFANVPTSRDRSERHLQRRAGLATFQDVNRLRAASAAHNLAHAAISMLSARQDSTNVAGKQPRTGISTLARSKARMMRSLSTKTPFASSSSLNQLPSALRK